VVPVDETLTHGRNAYRKGCRCEQCRYEFLAYKRWLYHQGGNQRPVASTTANYVVPAVGEAWRDHAACKGADNFLFFDDDKRLWKTARAMCAVCPVISQCREWALSYPGKDLFGFWAGMTQRERINHQNNQQEHPTCPTPVHLRRTGRVSGIKYGGLTDGPR
jgi:WhiB family redox-sensing transcriptional regulator